MNKKLILGLALAVVLVSGSLFSAQADCNFCLPHFSLPTCFSCAADQGAGKRQRLRWQFDHSV